MELPGVVRLHLDSPTISEPLSIMNTETMDSTTPDPSRKQRAIWPFTLLEDIDAFEKSCQKRISVQRFLLLHPVAETHS